MRYKFSLRLDETKASQDLPDKDVQTYFLLLQNYLEKISVLPGTAYEGARYVCYKDWVLDNEITMEIDVAKELYDAASQIVPHYNPYVEVDRVEGDLPTKYPSTTSSLLYVPQ